jgi:hypothetical protein
MQESDGRVIIRCCALGQLHNSVSCKGFIAKRCLHFLVLYRKKWVILESYYSDESNKIFNVFFCAALISIGFVVQKIV